MDWRQPNLEFLSTKTQKRSEAKVKSKLKLLVQRLYSTIELLSRNHRNQYNSLKMMRRLRKSFTRWAKPRKDSFNKFVSAIH